MNFATLPADILFQIFELLDIKSAARLEAVSKGVNPTTGYWTRKAFELGLGPSEDSQEVIIPSIEPVKYKVKVGEWVGFMNHFLKDYDINRCILLQSLRVRLEKWLASNYVESFSFFNRFSSLGELKATSLVKQYMN